MRNKAKARILATLAVSALLWPGTATLRGATINYQSWRFTGTTNNRAITISLRTDPLAISTNLVFGVPLSLQPTNGRASATLLPGGYWLAIDQVSSRLTFDVPDSTNSYNVIDLINRSLYVLSSGTNAVGFATAAGTNVTLTTNGAVVTVSLPAEPSFNGDQVSNVVATAVQAAFAIGDVSVTLASGWLNASNMSGGIRAKAFEGAVGVSNLVGTVSVSQIADLSSNYVKSTAGNGTNTTLWAKTANVTIKRGDGVVGMTMAQNGGVDFPNGFTATTPSIGDASLVGTSIAVAQATHATNADTVPIVTWTNRLGAGIASNGAATLYFQAPFSQPGLPAMGWNSYYTLGDSMTETDIWAVIAAFKTNLAQYGYRYVNLDDSWAASNRSSGHLVFNSRFPEGATGLSRRIHTNGCLFGLYEEPGPTANTSANTMPTGWGFWDTDAADFASWGVDYLKSDGPSGLLDGDNAGVQWFREAFASSMANAQRGMVIATSQRITVGWRPWMPKCINYVRWAVHNDVNDVIELYAWIDFIFNNVGREHFGTAINHHPDVDILGSAAIHSGEAGARSQYTAAALMSASWIISNPHFGGSETLQYLNTNWPAIGMNQDPLGICAYKAWSNNLTEVWGKPRFNTRDLGVGTFNRNTTASNVVVWFTNLSFAANTICTVYDCWGLRGLGLFTNSYTDALLGPTNANLFLLSPVGYSPLGITADEPAAKPLPFGPYTDFAVCYYPDKMNLAVGTRVASLTDFSTNAFNAMATDSATYPTMVLGQNNHRALLFDATNALYTNFTAIAQPDTVFVVCAVSNIAGTLYIFDSADASHRQLIADDAVSQETAYAGSGPVAIGGSMLNQYQIVEVLFNGTASYAKTNNVQSVAGNFGTQTMGGLTMGARNNLASNGKFALLFMAVFPYKMSPAQEANEAAWLKETFR